MKLNIRILTAIAVSLASFVGVLSSYGQNLPYVDIYQGKYAFAYYSGADGCIDRDIFIVPVEELYINPPFYGHKATFIDLSIYHFNVCTGEEIAGYTLEQIESSDFQIRNDFATATLNTTVTLFNSISSENIELDLNISWTEDSEKRVQPSAGMHLFPSGCRQILRRGDIWRKATVSGSITYNGTNLLGGPLEDAEIGRHQPGRVLVGCS